MKEDELVTLPRSLIEKLLDNDLKSKECTAKVSIETSKTNRWILIVGVISICIVLTAWILTPGDVQVDNTATSISESRGGYIYGEDQNKEN